MSEPQPMQSVRRRPIPGMASQPTTPPAPPAPEADHHVNDAPRTYERDPSPTAIAEGNKQAPVRSDTRQRVARETTNARRPAADYASTWLVNFRIPVDLHERFRGLVREAELDHPRLRRPSLTELLIALLEEGPQTGAEVAELIRRKRAAEHEER